MAVTVVYKGSQITSFSSATKTLKTSGKYLEDDIAVSVKCLVTITGTGDNTFCYVQHNGAKYYSATTFEITPGDTLTLYASGRVSSSTININGSTLVTNASNAVSATIQPQYDTTINLSSGSSATISVTIPVVTSGTYSVSSPGTKHIYTYTRISVPTGSVSISNSSAAIEPAISVSASGLITATASGSASVTPTITAGYVSSASAGNVTITGSSSLQLSTQGATTITPTENQQTAVASGKYTTGEVTVAGISSDYIGTAVAKLSSADLTVNGSTVTAPSGYYSQNASASISAGSAFTPATTISVSPSISVNSSTGVITVTASTSSNVTPTVTAGYVSQGTAGRITVSGSSSSQLTIQAAKTVTPTTTSQTAVASGRFTTGVITVAPIPSNYVDSSTLKTYYTGTSTPASSLGVNGDLYFQTSE